MRAENRSRGLCSCLQDTSQDCFLDKFIDRQSRALSNLSLDGLLPNQTQIASFVTGSQIMHALLPLTRLILSAICFFAVFNAKAASPIRLFNGVDLSGWTSWLRESQHEDPNKVFTVSEASIRISGEGYGYLATLNEFENYRLSLEFRWGDQAATDRRDRKGKALDSGVFLHASGPHGNSHDGDGAYMAAIECNVYQGATGDVLLIRGDDPQGKLIVPRASVAQAAILDADGFPFWSPGGRSRSLHTFGRINWLHKSPQWQDQRDFRGKHDLEKPYGEWNRLQCECRNRTITIRLNGTRINQVSQVYPHKGKVLLQCEGAEIFFRKILLTPIDSEKNSNEE